MSPFGESAPQALIREIQEELGIGCRVKRFLGLVEHQWESKGELQCEVNQIFEVELPNLEDPTSKEPKLEFFWSPINELHQKQLEPEPLCSLIPQNL
jgi:8-oxo-dGTP diphosphatase